MTQVKDLIVGFFSSIYKNTLKLLKSIGRWFLNGILAVYNFFKAIVLGVYRLIFKTTLKQKLIFLVVVGALTGAFYISRMNDLTFYSLEDQDRIVEEGKLIDLDYRRLKEENKYFTLYEDSTFLVQMDLTNTNVQMINKQTEAVYETISPLSKSEALRTPFTLTYKFKDSTVTQTMNAMTSSINEGSYQVYEIKNGVRVDYTVGDSKYALNDLPRFISPDKFEDKILNVISQEDQDLVLKYYKRAKDRDVYYPTNPKKDARRLYEIIFYESEYTFDDLAEDIYTYTGKDGKAHPKATFTFPIEYTFENDKLNVNVLFQHAMYHDEYQIVSMDLLPSFGGTLTSDGAYALVPDGSGGIVELNGVKGTNNVYMKSLYNNEELSDLSVRRFDEKATMPIFGMTDANQGIFAIIRNGADKTKLVLTLSNEEDEPNRIFPRIQNVDTYNHDFYNDGSTIIKYYSDNKTSEYSIEYHLLNETNNQYDDLAAIYRNYLIDTYQLEVQDEITSGMLVDIIGGIKREHNVMGIQFNKIEYATTYEQVIQILEDLKGLDHVSTIYTGWMNGGYLHDLPTTIKYDRAAGGEKAFEELVAYINDNQLNHYFDVSFIETYTKNDNGFRATEHGVTNIPNEVLKRYPINPNTLLVDKTSLVRYLVAPNYINSVVDRFVGNMKYPLSGLSLRDIGSLYYANYGRKEVDYTDAQRYLEKALTTLSQEGYDLLVKDGYNFTFPFSNYQTNLPITTSYNGVIDYAIPFKQLAYNGLFNYSGRSVNIGNPISLQKQILKSIEFGMDMKYTVSHEPSSFFADTDYTYYYDTKYADLKDEIFETAEIIQEAKLVIGNGNIVSHNRLADEVFKVTYENGKTLIFNYNNESVQVSGRTIPALDYIVE